ncbi:hypothetical protein E2C01_068372 [Portunus trituberculatus]|uniref:Uncharacterized protein n=1 Tax=Portunus trituberculatus TaxID=210409 RepID=A0A5B7HXP6_PORTR|nr:hypothetical protein [Portunus trituberculatus]
MSCGRVPAAAAELSTCRRILQHCAPNKKLTKSEEIKQLCKEALFSEGARSARTASLPGHSLSVIASHECGVWRCGMALWHRCCVVLTFCLARHTTMIATAAAAAAAVLTFCNGGRWRWCASRQSATSCLSPERRDDPRLACAGRAGSHDASSSVRELSGRHELLLRQT